MQSKETPNPQENRPRSMKELLAMKNAEAQVKNAPRRKNKTPKPRQGLGAFAPGAKRSTK